MVDSRSVVNFTRRILSGDNYHIKQTFVPRSGGARHAAACGGMRRDALLRWQHIAAAQTRKDEKGPTTTMYVRMQWLVSPHNVLKFQKMFKILFELNEFNLALPFCRLNSLKESVRR